MASNGKICATCKQHKGYEFFFLVRNGFYAPSCVACTPIKVPRVKVPSKGLRVCKKCDGAKYDSEYYYNRPLESYTNVCKVCRLEQIKAYRARNRPAILQSNRDYYQRKKEQAKCT